MPAHLQPAPTPETRFPKARAGRPRRGVTVVALALGALTWTTLAMEVPAHGWTAGFGLLAGTLSYAFMAIAVVFATRREFLETWFGPLDRLYRAHRLLGIGTLAGLGLHLLLRNDPQGSRIIDLATDLAFRPLGVVGAVLLGLSVVLAVTVRIPYHRWKPIHVVTMVAFSLLTAHALLAADALQPTLGFSMTVIVFAGAGLSAIALRIVDKVTGGARYEVAERVRGPREVEVTLAPRGRLGIPSSRAGQFAFLTATVGGRRETHPFTLTNRAGATDLSFAIRALGDWSSEVQEGLEIGAQVRVQGPFGDFTPLDRRGDADNPQVWIGAGAGVTPFVSAMRSTDASERLSSGYDRTAPVEFIVVARNKEDCPCWSDIESASNDLPWLRLTTAFSSDGARLDARAVDSLISRAPAGAEWFLCGPNGLTTLIARRLRRADVPSALVHREVFDWRGPRLSPWRTLLRLSRTR